jgi:hypothetical protein
MLFTDLLRLTVLLVAAEATVLGAITVVAGDANDDTATLIVGGAWWAIAFVAGLVLGSPERAGEAMAKVLSGARTATSLPHESPNRIALGRLWPLGVFALLAGGLGLIWPQVAAIGAGYALLIALSWRNREAVVTGVEDRDGVRFYVESSAAFEPVRIVRTPGLGRDRVPAGHPPPPPPAAG